MRKMLKSIKLMLLMIVINTTKVKIPKILNIVKIKDHLGMGGHPFNRTKENSILKK